MEIWIDVREYEGFYQVSNKGRVRSVDRFYEHLNRWGGITVNRIRGKIKKLQVDKGGYLVVKLTKNGDEKLCKVHRLVAEAFIPKENMDDMDVHHIDKNRMNNALENLEWIDADLHNHMHNEGDDVYQYTFDGELVKIWESTQECGRNGYNQAAVWLCCNGKKQQYKGYKWSYEPL